MKRTTIGIAVAAFLMLVGSVASAQPGHGRDDDNNGWQQDRRNGHNDYGQDWRNNHHNGHVSPTPIPIPIPMPLPALTTRPPVPQILHTNGRMGRHHPISPARLAAIRAELRLHSRRLATLNQIRVLAWRAGNRRVVSRVNSLIARENQRHHMRMAALTPSLSRLAHR